LNICSVNNVTEEAIKGALQKPWPHSIRLVSGGGYLADLRGMGPAKIEALKAHYAEPKDIPLRIGWDEYGLELAKTVALRADCTRRKVGAVLMMPDHSIAGTGYNGGYSGGPSCLKGECPRGQLTTEQLAPNSDYSSGQGVCIALHAEWNVLLRASWEQMIGSTLYVTDEPCHLCSNLIRGTHIKRVVWPAGERVFD
jgi:dCMP deaminase